MKGRILFVLIVLSQLFLPNIANAQVSEQRCDARTACPEGLECIGFPYQGLRCAEPNPCSYFKCPTGTQCTTVESYPSGVVCICIGPECPATSRDEETVEYNLSAQTVIRIAKENETISHDVSLWRTVSENRGILETTLASAAYSGELIIEDSKLFMKTSIGKSPINILPEDAVGISETPNIETVKKIELKEESQKPIYSIMGTKQTKILFIIPVSMEVETKINAETSDVISINRPWWSFLAF